MNNLLSKDITYVYEIKLLTPENKPKHILLS